MLTATMAYTLWGAAVAGPVGITLLYAREKKLGRRPHPVRPAVIAYLLVGLLGLALPLKLALTATSWFGMLMLTLFWPVWLGQGVFGYSLPDLLPGWFMALWFNLG